MSLYPLLRLCHILSLLYIISTIQHAWAIGDTCNLTLVVLLNEATSLDNVTPRSCQISFNPYLTTCEYPFSSSITHIIITQKVNLSRIHGNGCCSIPYQRSQVGPGSDVPRTTFCMLKDVLNIMITNPNNNAAQWGILLICHIESLASLR